MDLTQQILTLYSRGGHFHAHTYHGGGGGSSELDFSVWMIILAIIAGIVVIMCLMSLVKHFKHYSADQVFVVSWWKNKKLFAKCFHNNRGGWVFVWPFIQNCEYVSVKDLQPMDFVYEKRLVTKNVCARVKAVFRVSVPLNNQKLMNNLAPKLVFFKKICLKLV